MRLIFHVSYFRSTKCGFLIDRMCTLVPWRGYKRRPRARVQSTTSTASTLKTDYALLFTFLLLVISICVNGFSTSDMLPKRRKIVDYNLCIGIGRNNLRGRELSKSSCPFFYVCLFYLSNMCVVLLSNYQKKIKFLFVGSLFTSPPLAILNSHYTHSSHCWLIRTFYHLSNIQSSLIFLDFYCPLLIRIFHLLTLIGLLSMSTLFDFQNANL